MAAKLKVVEDEDAFVLPSGDMGKEEGSSFGYFDKMLFGWRDGLVFDYGDYEARDITEMMKTDYKANQIEKVMCLPIVSATRSIEKIKGDRGEHEWLSEFWEADSLNGGCTTPLDHITDLMTTAISYKRAYFELIWGIGQGDFAGKTVLKKAAWRPQTTCRLLRDPMNGGFRGFEQEAYFAGPQITKGVWPIRIPPQRSFVYIHGVRRDPLNGTSDMEIAYWAWKTKQKILFLWFQFLEAVSLPRTVVAANDLTTAQQIAGQIAKLKSSGIIPVAHSGNADQVTISPLDVSGKGSEEFRNAIAWLEQCATNSVLAGFLDLTSQATGTQGQTRGSNALSKNASDYFNQSLESKVREMEYSIRKYLFAPLVRYNFGADAHVPKLKFEPLNDIDKETSVELFQAFAGNPVPNPNIPAEFVEMLARQVADYIGLDGREVAKLFRKAAADAKKAAAAAGVNPAGQEVAGIAGATDAAAGMMQGKAPTPKMIQNPFDPTGPMIPEPTE